MTNSLRHARLAVLLAVIGLSGWSAVAQTTTTVTRKVSFEYDEFGHLKKEIIEPDNPALRLTTEYARAPVGGVDYGLVSSRTLTWVDPASGAVQTRVVEATGYDAKGRFILTATNARQQSTTHTFDDATGAVLSTTDFNQLVTSWEFDGWGRKKKELRADGTSTTWAYRQCVDYCGWAVAVTVSQQWAGTNQMAVPKEDFTDRLGRGVHSRTWGFDGTAVVNETAFTAQGYTASVARPRFQGASPVWTYYERDDIGRVNRIRSPAADGSGYADTVYTYNGLVLSMVNAKGQARVEERNLLGKLKSATDALGYTTTYVYDGFGNLARTRDPKGNQIDVGYDALGRKTSLKDPDLGAMAYWVDPLGQTWKERDAKGQETVTTFDELGRMTRRLASDQDARWEYDTASHGVGKLAESHTWVNGAKDVRRVMSYDTLGRPDQTTTSLDWDYISQTLYDSWGRAYGQSHTRRARGAGSGGVTTAVIDAFNTQGYVDRTYRRSDGVDTLIWQALQVDAENRSTRQQLGTSALLAHGYNAITGRLESVVSGPAAGAGVNATLQNDVYQYDVLGNLAYRAQLTAVGSLLQESFDYDPLNRLTAAHLGGQTQAFEYDALGNITSKANVGRYEYPESGYSAVRPHAVSSITGTVAGLVNPSFSYDANGNLLNGLNRAYTWSAADMPLTIDKLAAGQAVQRTEFLYGPDHERVRQLVRNMSGGQPQAVTNTIYYAGAIEKEIDVAANVTIIRTTLGPEGYVEERIPGTSVDVNVAGARQGRLFLKDHLGSVIGIVDEAGQLLQRMSYDAWGRRRNLDGSDDSWAGLGTIRNDQDNSGYTGHEQLDQLGLVHMNARLYDPITGRHVSADPTVPDPTDQQAFNRFSYVLNNAMSYVDPTGLGPEAVFTTLSNPLWAFASQKEEAERKKKEEEEAARKRKEKEDREKRCTMGAGGSNCEVIKMNGSSSVEWAEDKSSQRNSPAYNTVEGQIEGIRRAYATNGILDGAPETMELAVTILGLIPTGGGGALAAAPALVFKVGKVARGPLEGANFAQKTFGATFSKGGIFAGRSVDDVAAALKSKAMKPSEVPIDFIVRDGKTLILNTRSAQALELAGVPRSAWTTVNRTGQEAFESMLSGQLKRNGLTSEGVSTVRRSGVF